MRWFKRKKEQVGRVVDFLPLIWNSHDFDYSYSLGLFQKQLERQARFMESDKANLANAKDNAKRIRTAIELIGDVYGEKYLQEVCSRLEILYGNREMVVNDEGHLDFVNSKIIDPEQQEKVNLLYENMTQWAVDRTKKAEDLLWRFIAHNIRRWWD